MAVQQKVTGAAGLALPVVVDGSDAHDPLPLGPPL